MNTAEVLRVMGVPTLMHGSEHGLPGRCFEIRAIEINFLRTVKGCSFREQLTNTTLRTNLIYFYIQTESEETEKSISPIWKSHQPPIPSADSQMIEQKMFCSFKTGGLYYILCLLQIYHKAFLIDQLYRIFVISTRKTLEKVSTLSESYRCYWLKPGTNSPMLNVVETIHNAPFQKRMG